MIILSQNGILLIAPLTLADAPAFAQPEATAVCQNRPVYLKLRNAMTQIKSLTPKKCWTLLSSDSSAVLLDVRDRMEYSFIGHPKGAINIPWKELPDWRVNSLFVDEVRQRIPSHDTPVFLLCRSGQRSLDAAKALAAAGYQDLTNVEEGFEGPLDAIKHRGTLGGWRYHGLPWEQS
jgi:rhodanese-related sulfurtransferase